MGEKIKVDSLVLQSISFSLSNVSSSIDNISSEIKTLIKMGESIWKDTGSATGVFTNKNAVIKENCSQIAKNLKKHSSNLEEIMKNFEEHNNKNKKKTSGLDTKNLF